MRSNSPFGLALLLLVSKSMNGSIMKSLAEVLEQFRREGYVEDFNALLRKAVPDDEKQLDPEHFKVDKWYRIDEWSDPEEQIVVYAISSKRFPTLKGTLTNGYGVYSDPDVNAIVENLELSSDEMEQALKDDHGYLGPRSSAAP